MGLLLINVIFLVMNSTFISTPSGNTVKYFKSPNHPDNYPNNHSEVIMLIVNFSFFTNIFEGMEVGS